MTKQAERDYPLKVTRKELLAHPYSCPRTLRECAMSLGVFKQVVPPGGRVLDLGCGIGWTSQFLTRAGYKVVGIDISETMIDLARKRSMNDEIAPTFHAEDMEEMDLGERDFDAVMIFDALHHCPGWSKVLERACAHLRPGGHLLLLEPSWLHLISPHARETTKNYGVTELGFTRGALRRALYRAGFDKIWTWYDCGTLYRGLGGFLLANFRLWCNYFFCYPQIKQILLARKGAALGNGPSID